MIRWIGKVEAASCRFISDLIKSGKMPLLHYFSVVLLALQTLTADDVIVRTQLSPEEVWVGQRMQLQIDVLGKDGWAQITDLGDVEIPGSYVRPSGNSRVRLNETIKGESYSGQRYQLSIYPQRIGQQTLPPIELNVRIQTWGAQNSTQEIKALTDPIEFSTQLPKGCRPDLPLIVSPEFTATQTWEPDLENFKVGEALKRTLTLRAKELPAMVLPPLINEHLDGVSIYAERPQLEDGAQATRTESITYVFEQNTSATLPTYELQWWDPTTNQLHLLRLDGRTLSVTGGPSAAQAAPVDESNHLKIIVPALTVLGLAIVYILWISKARQSTDHTSSERAVFKQLTHAIQNDSPSDALNGLLRWLDCIKLRPSEFFEEHADPATQALVAQLLSDPQSVNALPSLNTGLKQARKHYQQSKRQAISKADRLLPPLNL